MTDQASPATRLHDVLVVHDQTGTAWRAAEASIRGGRIVVLSTPATSPPGGLLDHPSGTYTIQAVDGGNRSRRFPHLVYAPHHSHPPQEYVFD